MRAGPGWGVLVVGQEELNVERTRSINALTVVARSVDIGLAARHSLSKSQITILARC